MHVGERDIYATIQTRLKFGTRSLKTIQAFLFKGIIVLTFSSFSIAGNPKGYVFISVGKVNMADRKSKYRKNEGLVCKLMNFLYKPFQVFI